MNFQPAPFAARAFADFTSPSIRYARERASAGASNDNEYRRMIAGPVFNPRPKVKVARTEKN